MKEITLLTAAEARTISESSKCQLKRLAKEIESAAKENRCCVYWSVYETDISVKEYLGHELMKAGYRVQVLFDGSDGEFTDKFETFRDKNIVELLISW